MTGPRTSEVRTRAPRRARKPAHEEELGLRVEHRADGRLWAIAGERECAVSIRRCFPWSAPGEFLSLRDADDEEVALVRNLAEVDRESRRALLRGLQESAYVIDVAEVLEVEDEIEIRCFRVRTRDGERTFQTLRDEWPRPMPGGELLIQDVAGDLYRVADPESLDRRSRKQLFAFLD